jgi:hypothetical protein
MVETVFKGVLEMQQTLSDPKSWKKWLFVLKRVKSSGTASLEYYKEVKKEAKQNPKGVLNLLSNYTVQIVGSVATRKFVFEVRTLEQTFRLAAETREMMDEWVYFMQGQTQVSHIVSSKAKMFDVTPERTETLLRIGAQDVCRLFIESSEIVLALSSTGAMLARWPLECLRRYSCDQGIFSFEAGRKAPLGEGKYSFRTDEDSLIFDTLEHMVKTKASTLPRSQLQRSNSKQLPTNPRAEEVEHEYNTLHFVRGPDATAQTQMSGNEAGYAQFMNRTLPPSAMAHNEYDILNKGNTEVDDKSNKLEDRFKGMDLEADYTYAYTRSAKPPPLPPTGPPKRSLPAMSDNSNLSIHQQTQLPIPPQDMNLSLPADYEVPETGCYESAVLTPDSE